ncbi:MAG: hypothetical protein ACYCYI_02985 [Saccharofermentanales bacterium]
MDIFEQLEHELNMDGVTVSRDKLPKCIGFYTNYCDFIYLNVDRDLSGCKALSVLSHEMGHHMTGLIGDSGKNEFRADKWAANRMIDPADLISALLKGCRNFYELSRELNLDEQFIKHAIMIFSGIYGKHYEKGDHILSFDPLMVQNKISNQIWPEI